MTFSILWCSLDQAWIVFVVLGVFGLGSTLWHVFLVVIVTGCRSAHCGMFFSVVIVALCDERIGGARSEIIVRITAAEWISAVVEICGVDFAVYGLSCTG